MWEAPHWSIRKDSEISIHWIQNQFCSSLDSSHSAQWCLSMQDTDSSLVPTQTQFGGSKLKLRQLGWREKGFVLIPTFYVAIDCQQRNWQCPTVAHTFSCLMEYRGSCNFSPCLQPCLKIIIFKRTNQIICPKLKKRLTKQNSSNLK